jgi:hypothetical protein
MREEKSASLWRERPSQRRREAGGMSSVVCAAFQAAMMVGRVASLDAAKWASRGEERFKTWE